MNLRKAITLQADSCHILDPHLMIKVYANYLSGVTQCILMYHSVVKIKKKNCKVNFLKLSFKVASAYMLL